MGEAIFFSSPDYLDSGGCCDSAFTEGRGLVFLLAFTPNSFCVTP